MPIFLFVSKNSKCAWWHLNWGIPSRRFLIYCSQIHQRHLYLWHLKYIRLDFADYSLIHGLQNRCYVSGHENNINFIILRIFIRACGWQVKSSINNNILKGALIFTFSSKMSFLLCYFIFPFLMMWLLGVGGALYQCCWKSIQF